MLLIESIKVREVRGDQTRIVTQRPEVRIFDPPALMEETVETEIVRGRRLVDAYGEEFCIGMTREVAEVLKLPYDIYESMSNNISMVEDVARRYERKNYRLENRLSVIKEMSFWERFSRVFVGFSTLNLK